MDIFKYIKLKYLPLLSVYFAVGLAGLSAVTSTIFFKDIVSLSADKLIEISVYVSLPWSIKMVFGSLIDSVPLFGNNRKSYIIIGQLLVLLGMLGMVDHASTQYLFHYLGQYLGLLVTGLTTTIGVVVSDIVADVMAIELVEEGPDKDKELGMVQVLIRLALGLGGVVAALLTGFLAAHLPPYQVYMIALMCPLVALTATLLVKPTSTAALAPLNRPLLLGGLGYGVFAVLAGTFLSQDAVFLGSFLIIIWLMHGLLKEFDPAEVKGFTLAMVAIFLFRTVPGVGPAGGWWYMNSLHFTPEFMGTLRIIASVSGLLVLFGLARSITNQSILRVMGILTLFTTVLSLPDLLVYYHLTFGLSPHSVVLVDTAMIAPLAELSMIPLGVLIAKHAPAHQRAAYISLTASLMNISLVAGDTITKHLNKLFVVTRTDFSQMGQLMLASLVISTILSLIGLAVLWRSSKNA